MALPDYYFEGNKGYMVDNSFVLDESSDDVTFTTDSQNNAVIFEVSDFRGTFYCDHFRYKETIFVAKGHVTVHMKKIQITAGVKFGRTVSSDGRYIPEIDPTNITMDIDRRDIDIDIGGNIWADLSNLFEVFFKGPVIDSIEETAVAAMTVGIPKIGNGIMEALDGYFVIPGIPNWVVDWETPYQAVITDTKFAIGVKGLMFDREIGEEEPSQTIPSMPYYDSDRSEKYQAFVSAYSIDGFFSSMIEVVGIHAWVNSTFAAQFVELPMDTDTVNILLPGIVDVYGSGRPVDVRFNVTSLGQFGVSEANEEMSGLLSMTLEYWVEEADGSVEMACELGLNDVNFKFTALVENMDVALNITHIDIGSVDLLVDNIGGQ